MFHTNESVFGQWLWGESKENDEPYQRSFLGQFCQVVGGYKMSVRVGPPMRRNDER